mmetsp:Transcript_3307/g.4549  ORF Transcript_3307/g.4549 Transcript_3307/m.4549 type:complete len:121 (+) Transcript_3307:142-504(+)
MFSRRRRLLRSAKATITITIWGQQSKAEDTLANLEKVLLDGINERPGMSFQSLSENAKLVGSPRITLLSRIAFLAKFVMGKTFGSFKSFKKEVWEFFCDNVQPDGLILKDAATQHLEVFV